MGARTVSTHEDLPGSAGERLVSLLSWTAFGASVLSIVAKHVRGMARDLLELHRSGSWKTGDGEGSP